MTTKLSARFEKALHYAISLHAGQRRSGTSSTPRIAHLLGVATIAINYNATEDEAIGALLHEACEGEDGVERLAEVRQMFGDEVALIVAGCTDPEEGSPGWRESKEKHLARLQGASPSVRFVTAADKLDDVRFILRVFYAREERMIWSMLQGGRDATLWYYRALAETLREAIPAFRHDQKSERYGVVTELEKTVIVVEEFNRLDEIADRQAREREPQPSSRTIDSLLQWLNGERMWISLPPCWVVSADMDEDTKHEQMGGLLNDLGKYTVDVMNEQSADPDGEPVTVFIEALIDRDGSYGGCR